MRAMSLAIITLIAALHSFIAYFEMFAWETIGPKVFKGFPPEMFADTVMLAANQGMYNAFLAAGLIWALIIRDRVWQTHVASCFLLFVIVAGCFGAYTVSVRILVVQALPALVALVLLHVSRRGA